MKLSFNQSISTYWWNFGKKKNDFNGTISEFFAEKNIKTSTVTHPKQKDIKGIRFVFSLGSSNFRIDSFDYKDNSALFIVKMFLTYLGDTAQIKTASGKLININH